MMDRSLGAIGFVGGGCRLRADFLRLLAGSPAETVTCENGEYRVWRSSGGARLYVHVTGPGVRAQDGARENGGDAFAITGVTPFQDFDAAIDVTVTGIIGLDRADPLAGAYVCYLPPRRAGDRELQIVLEMVPFAATPRADLPFHASVEVLGLATEATVYPSLSAYFVRVASARLVAPGSVVPLLTSAGAEVASTMADDLRCTAVVTGTVLDSRRLVNSITDIPYWRLLVATERGTFALAAAETDMHGTPAVGAIVQAKARLVGRLRAIAGPAAAPAPEEAEPDEDHPAVQPRQTRVRRTASGR